MSLPTFFFLFFLFLFYESYGGCFFEMKMTEIVRGARADACRLVVRGRAAIDKGEVSHEATMAIRSGPNLEHAPDAAAPIRIRANEISDLDRHGTF